MGKKSFFALLAFAVVFGAATCAFAGIVTDSFLCSFPDDPKTAKHIWSYDYGTDTLALTENILAIGDDSVNMCGDLDSDPTFTVTKTVTNDTAFAWTGYTISLNTSAGDSFVAGTATSNVFNTVNQTSSLLTFSAPNAVAPGGSVTMSFQINIPSTTSFNFSITQSAVPVPEPSAVAIFFVSSLALGLGLIRRRA